MVDVPLMNNPMTTQDDIIVGGASGAPTRLAKGTDGQRLTVDPATHHLAWADPVEVTEITDLPTAETDTSLVLAPDGAGGVEFRAETGGGGGSDLVQVASGAGSVRIPGILVADRVPASPNAADDEFDALSGWTTYGTPNANVTDAASLLHLSNASPGTFQLHGIYKAVPSMPFTVTARLNDLLFSQTYQSAFLMLLETGPGKVMQFGPLYAGSPSYRNLGFGVWASRTSRSSFTDNLAMSAGGGVGYVGPLFIRLVVTSSTNIATSASFSGLPGTFYSLNTGINPSFTVAYVGLGITGQDNNVPLHAYFDWIRFS